MRRLRLAAVVAVGLSMLPARAYAYRPFDGTDADVAELHVFELELGPIQYYRQGSQNYLEAPALVLNLGILPRTELVIDANQFVAIGPLGEDVPRVSLVGDDVLLKYLFREGTLQGETGLSIAAEGGVLTPVVPDDARFGASLDVITSYEWSWGTFHWNEWFEYTREHQPDLFTGVILEGPHEWVVRPVSELFYDTNFSNDQTASVLVGAIWSVRESLAFDVGVRGARTDGEYAVEARLGLTWSVRLADRNEGPAPREGAEGPSPPGARFADAMVRPPRSSP
jgi:hypothetical protein